MQWNHINPPEGPVNIPETSPESHWVMTTNYDINIYIYKRISVYFDETKTLCGFYFLFRHCKPKYHLKCWTFPLKFLMLRWNMIVGRLSVNADTTYPNFLNPRIFFILRRKNISILARKQSYFTSNQFYSNLVSASQMFGF